MKKYEESTKRISRIRCIAILGVASLSWVGFLAARLLSHRGPNGTLEPHAGRPVMKVTKRLARDGFDSSSNFRAFVRTGFAAVGFVAGSACFAQGDVIPGIKNYVVVLPEFQALPDSTAAVVLDSAKNMAGDVSDLGLIAGRVKLSVGFRAFGWAMQAQYGLSANEIRWLPIPSSTGGRPFSDSEAFDVSEYGVIVGGVGGITSLAEGTLKPRGVIWRLGDAVSAQLIEPPPAWPQGSQGVTLLEAVSAELPLRAVGYAGSVYNCLGSGACSATTGGRPSAMVAAFDDATTPSTPQYLTDPAAAPDAETDCAPKARILGVSRQSEFFVGSQNTMIGCDLDPTSGGIQCTPTRWDRELETDSLALIRNAVGPEVPEGEVVTAEVRSVSVGSNGIGTAVGYLKHSVYGNVALPTPHAWRLPPIPTATESLALPLPFVDAATDGNTVGGTVDDIERARWLPHGGSGGQQIAVGQMVTADHALDGAAIWYWTGASWTASAWSAVDVNSPAALSPLWGIHIERLRGVNQHGDCVGTAVVAGVHTPVVLRAVHCFGDLDWDGRVTAADLSILLGGWCPLGACTQPNPAADLDRDGSVDSPDLSLLLSVFGADCGTGVSESPVPELIAAASKASVDFSAMFVGLTDIEGYRAWAPTAPEPARQIIEQIMWIIAQSRN